MFHLFIATPEAVLFDAEVSSLKAPGADGYFEVLQNHAALISSLVPGRIEATDKKGEKWIWACADGFIEVFHNKVSVLIDSGELRENIDLERATRDLEKAEKMLESQDPTIDKIRARHSLLRAKNRIKVATTL